MTFFDFILEEPIDIDKKADLPAENNGLIFLIQGYSLHDGPGIRTTVFLKGCPLDCAWCSNPESRRLPPILLVRDSSCRRCGACEKVCPEGAIAMVEGEGRRIDWSLCSQCLQCVDACIYGSLNRCGREMAVAEVVAEVLRDVEHILGYLYSTSFSARQLYADRIAEFENTLRSELLESTRGIDRFVEHATFTVHTGRHDQ